MWAVKGHYFTPFYNWPYTFGLLFGIGLYARYVDDPERFRSGYDDLLSTVGMADAATLAARFGFDVRERDFWAESLAVVDRHVDDYERLATGLTRRIDCGADGRSSSGSAGGDLVAQCERLPAGAAPAWTFVPTAPGWPTAICRGVVPDRDGLLRRRQPGQSALPVDDGSNAGTGRSGRSRRRPIPPARSRAPSPPCTASAR